MSHCWTATVFSGESLFDGATAMSIEISLDRLDRVGRPGDESTDMRK